MWHPGWSFLSSVPLPIYGNPVWFLLFWGTPRGYLHTRDVPRCKIPLHLKLNPHANGVARLSNSDSFAYEKWLRQPGWCFPFSVPLPIYGNSVWYLPFWRYPHSGDVACCNFPLHLEDNLPANGVGGPSNPDSFSYGKWSLQPGWCLPMPVPLSIYGNSVWFLTILGMCPGWSGNLIMWLRKWYIGP